MSRVGSYRILVEDRTVWVTVSGISTELAVEEYTSELRRATLSLIAKPWAIVLDLRKWQASPAGIFPLLQQLTSWCLLNNLRHSEIILPQDSLMEWQFVKTTNVTKPDALKSQIAENEQSARLSLQAAGYLNQPRGS